MKTLKTFPAIYFSIFFFSLFISCQSDENSKIAIKPQTFNVSLDYYSILYMDADTFKAKIQVPPTGQGRKDGTVALRYKIKDDAFEMDGWQVAKQGNNFFFKEGSKISFQKGIATQVPISSGDDLGSIIMDKNLVKDILNAINSNNYDYLVLVPSKPGNIVKYEVKLSSSPSGLISEFQGKDSLQFRSIKIGDMDDPIPPGGGGILNN